jgi:hypothetical protein
MRAIPMRAYVVNQMVNEATVRDLLVFGEPMITEEPAGYYQARRWYRAWIRLRAGGRTFGRWDFSAQFAAEALLAKLRAGR